MTGFAASNDQISSINAACRSCYGLQDESKIYFLASGQGVCVEACPLTTNYTEFICYDEVYAEVIDNETGEVRPACT